MTKNMASELYKNEKRNLDKKIIYKINDLCSPRFGQCDTKQKDIQNKKLNILTFQLKYAGLCSSN
jgi:hypothetical protein